MVWRRARYLSERRVPNESSRWIYLDGVALTDLDALRKMYGQDFDAERTLLNALNTWSLRCLSCDFFHADVHAGNLLAMEDGRVAFLDFGIVGGCLPGSGQHMGDAGASMLRRIIKAWPRRSVTWVLPIL